MPNPICSCGDPKPHEIARRTTADGKRVLFWSDGLVTWAMGWRLPGVGAARDAYGRGRDLRAARVVMGLVELLDAAEVPVAVKAARRSVARPGLPMLDSAAADAVVRREILEALKERA